jgi:cobalamin biosynthesis Mg chelatase CobN
VTAQVGADAVVQGLYQNLFERAQTQADLDYWTPQLTGSSTTASEMALNLITAAKTNTERPADGNVLGFKREAGTYYAENVPQAKYTVSTARTAVKDVNDAETLADSKTATDVVKNGRLRLTSSGQPLPPANSERSSISDAANDAGAPATLAGSNAPTDTIEASLAGSNAPTDTIEASLADSKSATGTVEASGMKTKSATAGAGDDETPSARSPAAPIPSLPLNALLLLIGLLSLIGLRRLRV